MTSVGGIIPHVLSLFNIDSVNINWGYRLNNYGKHAVTKIPTNYDMYKHKTL